MTADRTLETVRKDIDAIDAAIHELIIQRTELVEEVRRIKHDWPVKIQPSREAEIVYRLLAKHRGAFPRRELVAIWRQLINATLSFEGPLSIAVFTPDDDTGYWDLARDHFGMFTPITRHGTVRSVIEAVRRMDASVGVLPMPSPDDMDPWWRHLVTHQPDTPRIIARLPFAGPTNARGSGVEALAVCPVNVIATGRDRCYLAGDSESELSASQFIAALKRAELVPVFATQWQEPDKPRAVMTFVEIDGFVGADEKRLERVRQSLGNKLNRLVWLGGYSAPLTVDDLGPPSFTSAFSVTRLPRGETAPST